MSLQPTCVTLLRLEATRLDFTAELSISMAEAKQLAAAAAAPAVAGARAGAAAATAAGVTRQESSVAGARGGLLSQYRVLQASEHLLVASQPLSNGCCVPA